MKWGCDGMGKWECGRRKAERSMEMGMRKGERCSIEHKAEGRGHSVKGNIGRRKWEWGLRPVGAIGAYAPEGRRKWEWIG